MRKRNLSHFNWKALSIGALSMLSAILVSYWIFPFQLVSNFSKHEMFLIKAIEVLSEKSINKPKKEDLVFSAIEGMVKNLNDPYAVFEANKASRQSKNELPGLKLFRNRVLYPIPKSEAETKGVMPGDQILSVNGKKVADDMSNVSAILTESKHNKINVTLHRPGENKFNIEIQKKGVVNTVGNAQIIDEEFGIAHLPISSFQESTPQEVIKTLSNLEKEGMKALIIDLRYNLGGNLNSAIKVASIFFKGDLVCTIYDRNNKQKSFYAIQELSRYPTLPLVVLVNHLSASGSEIIASALQEHQRAYIAGSPSYGKGFAQETLSQDSISSTLKYSTGHYVTPKGNSLQKDLIKRTQQDGLKLDFKWDPPSKKSEQEIIKLNTTTKIPEEYLQSVRQHFPNLFQDILEIDPWLKKSIELFKDNP